MNGRATRCDWLAIWLLWSAWCSLVGWALSTAGLLDRMGYVVTTLLFAGLLVAQRRWPSSSLTRPPWLFRRSTYRRHLLPKLWLAGLAMIMLGGLLHRPTDYDYLTYRFPRLLHWWWDHRWFWIDSTDDRVNTSAVGMEWMMAPSFFLFRTDRLFFLINVVSFLFLPGLIFSVFRQLGVGRRMAWNWMWLLPFGYCYALQAGSAANDTFAAVPFLAALYYAGRAGPGQSLAAPLSIIALALLTGDKASNIPLGLPWLIVIWLNRKAFFDSTRPALLAGACVLGLVCSFVPVGLLNLFHTGTITGDPQNIFQLEVKSPVEGIIGNGIEILTGAIAPPMWPHALNVHVLSDASLATLKQSFPRYRPGTVPFQLEDNAGIGLGVTLMTAFSVLAGIIARIHGGAPRRSRGAGLFALAAALSLTWYMIELGSEAAPRLVAVYYVAVLAALLSLLPENGAWPRSLAWRAAAAAVMIIVLPLLLLNPARPLLPTQLIGLALRAVHAPPSAVAQLESNYRLRFSRLDLFQPLRLALPSSVHEIAVVERLDDPESAWWIPFGSRQVVRGHPEHPGSLAGRYVAVNTVELRDEDHMNLPDLLRQNSLRIVQREEVTARTGSAMEWNLLAPLTPAP